MSSPLGSDDKRPKTGLWVSTTYFAEGLPYTIVRLLSTVYFTDVGAQERYLGYLNFLGIPWNFKFLWSPLVDAISTKRRWLVILQTAIACAVFAVAVLCGMGEGGGEAANPYYVGVALVFCAMAFLASTNDIAIDGYYLEGITDKAEQAAYTGVRVTAYRAAIIYGRSGMVFVTAALGSWWAIKDPGIQWAYAFGAGALTMFGLAVYHALRLPRFEAEERPRAEGASFVEETMRFYGRAFASYLTQEKIGLILLFLVLYKLGDDVLFAMVTPFLRRELKVSSAQYAWIAGLVGAVGSSAGAILGGWWIKKRGLKRAIWPMTIFMNVNIWAYCWVAWAKPDPLVTSGLAVIAVVHGYEQLAGGLGNAALVVYLLRTTKPDFKAAHYAIGSAIMSLGFTVFGGFSGWVVENVGYFWLFVGAFVLSLPSMILLFFVPLKEEGAA